MKLYLGTDSGMFVFEGSEEEWHPRYVRLQERRVTALTVAGEDLWIGTTAGLWHSADGGATCIAAHTGETPPHVRAVARSAREPGLILVGTEPAAILISRDGGGTWEAAPDVARLRDAHGWSLPYSPAAGCIRGFAVLRSRIYAAAEVGGVLRSDDEGKSWELLQGGVHADVHHVSGHFDHPGVVLAATGGGRYRTQDAGKSWELVGDGYTRAIWTDPERPEILLAGPARYVGAMGRVERTLDGGDSWALASDGLRVPMSDMIEGFTDGGSFVVAVTSDGELYTAKRGLWFWHGLDLGVGPVRAAAFTED